jgi:hypothetical protein
VVHISYVFATVASEWSLKHIYLITVSVATSITSYFSGNSCPAIAEISVTVFRYSCQKEDREEEGEGSLP